MFDKESRYITKGVKADVDIRLQVFMWGLIDKLKENKNFKLDYLQVFNICKKDYKILLEHSQEVPEYKKLYEIKNVKYTEIEEKLKLFVIDDVDHSTMLLSQEY